MSYPFTIIKCWCGCSVLEALTRPLSSMMSSSPPTKDEVPCLSAAPSDIPFLLRYLRPHLPRSAKVFHTLRSCQTAFSHNLDLSIFVDSFDPSRLTSVVLTYTTRPPLISDSSSPPPSPPPSCVEGRNVCFFTVQELVVLSMLKRLVCFDAQFEFAGIEQSYRPLLSQLSRWWEEQPHSPPVTFHIDYDPCRHFSYPALEPPPPSSSPPDPTLILCSLPSDEATASLISSHWPYSSPSTPPHIQSLLSHFGGVGAYRHGHLIAWTVRQLYGALGMVHVLKEERGKGVGRAVIAEVVRRELERRRREKKEGLMETGEVVDEWTPFCYINDGNDVSVKLFTSVGFTPEFPIDWQTWTPSTSSAHPPISQQQESRSSPIDA